MSHGKLQGKVVVITGAAGGLGTALCLAYAHAGAQVAAIDVDAAALAKLRDALHAERGVSLFTISGEDAGDIADPTVCPAAVAQIVDNFGRLDVLINNAGISHRSLLGVTDPAVIRRVMEVNFFGTMQMTHAALPHLIKSGGKVVAISSVAGFAPLLGRTGYAASKHALHGFFDSLRTEVEPLGVQVSLVCPSFIATGIGAAALGGKGGTVATARVTAGGESNPQDIAERILAAVDRGQRMLLPDRTSRMAWWVNRFAPVLYARTMTRRVCAEFSGT